MNGSERDDGAHPADGTGPMHAAGRPSSDAAPPQFASLRFFAGAMRRLADGGRTGDPPRQGPITAPCGAARREAGCVRGLRPQGRPMLRPLFTRRPLARRLFGRAVAALTVAAAAGSLAAPTGAQDPLAAGTHAPHAAPEDYAFLNQEGYVALNAPLYPSPRQDIPVQVGGTMITNPAFAPHEYLYAHDYNALYGPFYHRARGHWVITPWGVRTREKWDLVGTEVKVKYRSRIPFFTGFKTPFNSRHTLFDNEWGNTPGYGSPATGSPNFHH
ncbi:MAG: hypothetical protein AAF907_05915 [Planctomycetota bacterium]